MKLGAIESSPAFGRKFINEQERQACERDIRRGLAPIDKNVAIILPTNCSPVYANEDTGVGTPYSNCATKELYPFLSTWGYTSQQKQPAGLGKLTDASPYVSNSSAYNTQIIDLKKLTTPDMGRILSEETYNEIVENNPKKGQNKGDYKYNVNAGRGALQEAYETFSDKKAHLKSLDKDEQVAIKKLDKEFQTFKKEHGKEQEKNALYNILTDIHGNDYWPNWGNEVDKNLFSTSDNKHVQKERQERLSELRKSHADDIDSFLFSQMLAKKTLDEGNEIMEANGLKSIGDIPVAFSDAEVWGNKDLFLSDFKMGCQEPWSKDNPQRWGFFVLDPNQLFNRDGSLGKAGQFLYDKYARAFEENKGGVRIDHIVGLMDPYVYNEKNHSHDGRLYTELFPGTNGHRCERILKDIVLVAAKDAGLDSSNIIAEDLGYMPGCTKQTLNELGIGGTGVTQWMNPQEVAHAPKGQTIAVANHDTPSAKEKYPDNNERKNQFVNLFASGAKKIQIMWTDMFGIKERYNQPGVTGDENWSLRMTEGFNDEYHKQLERGEAINMPEVILEANLKKNPHFWNDHRDIAEALNHWKHVLKEPEPKS